MERLSIFPERLLLARRRRDMSQEEVASKAGLFKTDISKYERGQSQPSLARLKRLAEVLAVSTDYLVGLVDDPPHTTIQEMSLTELSVYVQQLEAKYAKTAGAPRTGGSQNHA